MLISKKKNKEFVDGVTNGLLEIGAKQVENNISHFKTFELNTIVGKLTIDVVVENTVMFMVFSRFENVELAKHKFDCNPYSGKYNFMELDSTPIEKSIELALMHFEATLPKELA